MQTFFGSVFSWPIVVGHVRLNFLVPYAVSSYSAARNQLSRKVAP